MDITRNLLAYVCFSEAPFDQFNNFIPMLARQIGKMPDKVAGHFMDVGQMLLDQYLVLSFVFALVALK